MAGGKVRTAKSGVPYFEKFGEETEEAEFEMGEDTLHDSGLEDAVRDLITAAQVDEEEPFEDDGSVAERIAHLRDLMQKAIKDERYEDAGDMKQEIERLEKE